MTLRLAFAGFRHGHIMALYRAAGLNPQVKIVAACEEDPAAGSQIAKDVAFTHQNFEQMLDMVECDAVAIGDYYSRRGSLAIAALQRGKHVIADKPLATSVEEVDAIAKLAQSKNLKVGCMLDLLYGGNYLALRQIIRAGRVGRVHQIIFTGQHPLLWGKRPSWYFEKGKHGGTINDIAIHAVGLLPWLTGVELAQVVAARTWNAFASQFPHFMDSAQMMLTMADGAGVLGDVSYAMPDDHGYTLPLYWRCTVLGTHGVAETSAHTKGLTLAQQGVKEIQAIEPAPIPGAGSLQSFLDDIAGKPDAVGLNTARVLRASRQTLLIQQAADRNQRDLKL